MQATIERNRRVAAPLRRAAAVLLLAAGTTASPARAGDLYATFGLPTAVVGYAQPLNERVTLRGDIGGNSGRDVNESEDGIDYRATGRLRRAGLFADWFVAGGGFRLSAGITSNDASIRMRALTNGQPITIGGTTYQTAAGDRFEVSIRYPTTMPYLGVGWGHRAGERGFGFVFDAGVSIGRVRVGAKASGPNLGNVSQDDIDRELFELRDTFRHLRVLPQASVGFLYRF